MNLITQQDVLKMNFNSERREIKSVGDYMRLYLKILQLAFEYDVITAERRDAIAGAILVAIHKAAYGKEVIVSNYVYAISMRFMELSNYECWMLMNKIQCQEDANTFVDEIKDYFVKRIAMALKTVKRGYKRSLEIKSSSINDTWKECYNILSSMAGSLERDSKFNLKSWHTENSVLFRYATMRVEEGVSCVDVVENFIRNFDIETAILLKLDVSKVMNKILEQRMVKLNIEDSSALELARQELEEATQNLKTLKTSFDERMRFARASEEAYMDVYEEFEENHPEMDEDELEEAFEEYWKSHPKYCSEDFVTIESEYHHAKLRQERQIEICQRRVETLENLSCELEYTTLNVGDEVTLQDVLMECALVFLVHCGHVSYPSNNLEKEQILSSISIQQAIQIFVQNKAEDILLTAEEYEYLTNV